MNIYQKLTAARKDIHALALKKTGENKFSGFSYYELSDFLPQTLAAFETHGLCGLLTFTAELGTLRVVNSDLPEEQITFTSPMSTAQLKACHEVQNLGAVITYLRRYLWMNAVELLEQDNLDPVVGKDEPKRPATPPPKAGSEPPKPIDVPAFAAILHTFKSVKELEDEYKRADFQTRLALNSKQEKQELTRVMNLRIAELSPAPPAAAQAVLGAFQGAEVVGTRPPFAGGKASGMDAMPGDNFPFDDGPEPVTPDNVS